MSSVGVGQMKSFESANVNCTFAGWMQLNVLSYCACHCHGFFPNSTELNEWSEEKPVDFVYHLLSAVMVGLMANLLVNLSANDDLIRQHLETFLQMFGLTIFVAFCHTFD